MRRTLIHGARQLLTLRGGSGPRRGTALNNLGLIEDGALLIEDGVIVEVGPSRRVANLARAKGARDIDAHGRVVMPGFIDCHAHLVSASIVTRGDPGGRDAAPAARIRLSAQLAREIAAPKLSADAMGLLRRACAHGTTSVCSLTGFGLSPKTEMKLLRVTGTLLDTPVQVMPSFFGLHMPPAGFEGSRADLVRAGQEAIGVAVRRGLARVVHVACGEGCFSGAECAGFAGFALQHDLVWRLDYAAYGPSEPLGPLLAYRPRSADHLDWARPEDLLSLAESETIGVLLPGQVFHCRGRGQASGRQMVDSGAAIALGTDCNRATAPGCSMQSAIYLASRRMGLTAEEAISAATMNSACVVRSSHRLGSLEPGKQADLVMLGVSDYRELTAQFGVNLVEMTIKDGEVVYSGAGIPECP